MNTPASTMALGLHYLSAIANTDQPAIVEALKEVAPDLARMTISFGYGEIYARPGLDLRQRQMVTMAALAALGNAQPQLRFHIAGALHVGCTPEQVVELMMHLSIYAGFPAALNGVFAAKEVYAAQGVTVSTEQTAATSSRYEDGLASLRAIDGDAGERVLASLQDVAPDLGRFIIAFCFGEIYTRPGLDTMSRELATVAALAAMGDATPQLKVHMHGFLNVGGTGEQLVEIVTQIAVYAGFPRAINAALAAKEVLHDRAQVVH